MKKQILSCFILLLALVACSPKQGNKNNIDVENGMSLSETEIQFQEEVMYVNIHERLQVKRFPSMDSETIASLGYLAKVLVIRKNNNVININGINGKMVYISSPFASMKPEGGSTQGWVFDQYLSKIDSFIDEQFNIDELSILGVWSELYQLYVFAFKNNEEHVEGAGSYFEGGNWRKNGNTLTLIQNHSILGGGEFRVVQKEESIDKYKISAIDENIIILELLNKSKEKLLHFYYDNIIILKREGDIENHYVSWANHYRKNNDN